MLRIKAVTFTVMGLLALIITAILAKNWVAAIAGSLIEAVFWSAMMIFFTTRWVHKSPPRPVSLDELPPRASARKWVLPGVALLAAFYAAAAAYSLIMQQYFTLGIALGGPIIMWDGYRRAKRDQRKSQGILWSPMRWLQWKGGRVVYLSPADRGNENDW